MHLTSSSGASENPSIEPPLYLHWPPALLGSLVIVLAGLASLRQALGPWLPFTAVLTILIVLAGAWKMRRDWLFLLVAIATAWLVLADAGQSFKVWRWVSSHPDAWSYGALSDYLAKFPRGLSTGMPAFDQWASHLQNSRFASPGILALCAWLTGHDRLIEAHALFYSIVLVTLFFSTAQLGTVLGFSRNGSLALGFFGTALGWTTNALIVGNYDNLVYVALFPSAASWWIALFNGQVRHRIFLIHAPIVTAALIYAYPEGLGLSAVLMVPWAVAGLWRLRHQLYLSKPIAGACALVLVLVAPYLSVFIPFLVGQINHGASIVQPAARAGTGVFNGLLDQRFGPGFWALGNEYPGSPAGVIYFVLPGILFVLTAIGAWIVGKKNPWFPWVTLPLAALLLWQARFSVYDYGTYKVIFCAQWWIFPAVLSGGMWLAARLPHARSVGVVSSVLLLCAAWQRWALHKSRVWPPMPVIAAAAELPALRSILDSQPLILDINDPTGQMWALAYLRDQPLVLLRPKGYLGGSGSLPLTSTAMPVSITEGMFALRDGQITGSIWQNANFSLLGKATDALILTVGNPNGLEIVNGEPYIWIAATKPTIFSIQAFQAGNFELSGKQLSFGPTGKPSSNHSLEVIDAGGVHEVVLSAGNLSIPVTLHTGVNQVSIRSTAPIGVAVQANGDTRELMVGLTGYFVKSASPARPQPR